MIIKNIQHDTKSTIKHINDIINSKFIAVNEYTIENYKDTYFRVYIDGDIHNYITLYFNPNYVSLCNCGFNKTIFSSDDSITSEFGKIAGNDIMKIKSALVYIFSQLADKKNRHRNEERLYNFLIKFGVVNPPKPKMQYFVELEKDGEIEPIDEVSAYYFGETGEFNKVVVNDRVTIFFRK